MLPCLFYYFSFPLHSWIWFLQLIAASCHPESKCINVFKPVISCNTFFPISHCFRIYREIISVFPVAIHFSYIIFAAFNSPGFPFCSLLRSSISQCDAPIIIPSCLPFLHYRVLQFQDLRILKAVDCWCMAGHRTLPQSQHKLKNFAYVLIRVLTVRILLNFLTRQ